MLATVWRFTKIKLIVLKNMQVLIWSDLILTRKCINIWKCTKLKVYTTFLFKGQAFWKENIVDRVKLLESNILNGCLKIIMADLHKIGPKMREWSFRELSSKIPSEGGPCPSLHYPPPPRKVHLWHIFFALPTMNGRLTAGLKFRENNRLLQGTSGLKEFLQYLQHLHRLRAHQVLLLLQ